MWRKLLKNFETTEHTVSYQICGHKQILRDRIQVFIFFFLVFPKHQLYLSIYRKNISIKCVFFSKITRGAKYSKYT